METTHEITSRGARATNSDDRARPRFLAMGATDRGRLRPRNEDAALIRPELGLFLVADGISGQTGDEGGAEAAQLAVDTIAERVRRADEDPARILSELRGVGDDGGGAAARLGIRPLLESGERDGGQGLAAKILRAAVEHADRRISERGRAACRPEMGTTIAALLVAGPCVVVAHVGDSRVYRLRGASLEQLTSDHTMAAAWEQLHGRAAPQDIRALYGHVLTRALGGKQEGVSVDLRVEPWQPGDRFLLCSDGLHGLVSDADMAQTIANAADLDRAVVQLVKRANDAGGHDNIAAIVVRMLGT